MDRNSYSTRLALILFASSVAGAGPAFAADTPPAATASITAAELAAMSWSAYASTPPTITGPNAEQVKRGKYLVTTSGCNDCHTPFKLGPNGPEPDMGRMLSGHPEQLVITAPAKVQDAPWVMSSAGTNTAHSGPWGVSFTANLTPDPETGIGRWTLRNFTDTIRSGRHLGRGRAVLPPMPIAMYRHMTDEDLAAVFAYLQSIPAVNNRVPEPLPPAAATAATAAMSN